MHVLPCRCTCLRACACVLAHGQQPCSLLIRSALSGTERDVTLTEQEGAATIKVDVCLFSVKEVKDRKAVMHVCRLRVELPAFLSL